jgi:DNA topoisomerase-1
MKSSFIGCSNYPECRYTRGFGAATRAVEDGGDRELGVDPDTGAPVSR